MLRRGMAGPWHYGDAKSTMTNVHRAIMSDIKLCVGLHGLKVCVCTD